eukprot:CAMPEP_0172384058 /NCGR_PEP_ID=MMETSP1061-20121228/1855_1 /TAXON_ID=37318 /ORGANISM="Pseudo-nitzschia pungens, Strain cf. pungens" /LENGTH=614 /DNA_ID=CAMNT_0013112545 /DNA_START=347 /DNA_END=2191 /DNA_ORIENTATION=-
MSDHHNQYHGQQQQQQHSAYPSHAPQHLPPQQHYPVPGEIPAGPHSGSSSNRSVDSNNSNNSNNNGNDAQHHRVLSSGSSSSSTSHESKNNNNNKRPAESLATETTTPSVTPSATRNPTLSVEVMPSPASPTDALLRTSDLSSPVLKETPPLQAVPSKPSKKARKTSPRASPSGDGGSVKSTGTNAAKGLRHFSMMVCQKVEEKGTTTYNEVADELVRKVVAERKEEDPSGSFDQKNIRRRVYDALNVLMAMDIISKEKKEITWKGLPTAAKQDLHSMEEEIAYRKHQIAQKKEALRDLLIQQVCFRNLVQRNHQRECSKPLQHQRKAGAAASDGRIPLPFLVVNTDKSAETKCDMSKDLTFVSFNFSLPFEVRDNITILKGMQMDRTSRSSLRQMFPEDLLHYCETNGLTDAVLGRGDPIEELPPIPSQHQHPHQRPHHSESHYYPHLPQQQPPPPPPQRAGISTVGSSITSSSATTSSGTTASSGSRLGRVALHEHHLQQQQQQQPHSHAHPQSQSQSHAHTHAHARTHSHAHPQHAHHHHAQQQQQQQHPHHSHSHPPPPPAHHSYDRGMGMRRAPQPPPMSYSAHHPPSMMGSSVSSSRRNHGRDNRYSY